MAIFPGGTGEDYWSIDDILASQERVPCKVEQPLYRLGYLGSNDQEHLLQDTKLELPMWLAKGLCTKRRRIVSISYPKTYKEAIRSALEADANTINLHRNGPYFFSFGIKLLSFDLPERGHLANSLLEVSYIIPQVWLYMYLFILQTFIKRFRKLMDESQNAFQIDLTMFTKSLDQMEKYLFSLGQEVC